MTCHVRLIKSKQRVADHGEVFTPAWMAKAMLDLVRDETECIESRCFEPACGRGEFLTQILVRKLGTVRQKYRRRPIDARQNALIALMSIYGVELLSDNIAECRASILDVFASSMNVGPSDHLFRAASFVVSQNIVHGDALTMRTNAGRPIIFAEWVCVGKGKFQRRDFRLDTLSIANRVSREGQHGPPVESEVFAPVKIYPLMTLHALATAGVHSATREAG